MTAADSEQLRQLVHELRTPLSVFSLTVQVLQHLAPPELNDHLQRLQHTVKQMVVILDRLVTLATPTK